MKLGILILVLGILLLVVSIPYSMWSILSGAVRLIQSDQSGGLPAYVPLIGVVLGFILTTIGVTRVFGRPRSR